MGYGAGNFIIDQPNITSIGYLNFGAVSSVRQLVNRYYATCALMTDDTIK